MLRNTVFPNSFGCMLISSLVHVCNVVALLTCAGVCDGDTVCFLVSLTLVLAVGTTKGFQPGFFFSEILFDGFFYGSFSNFH